MKELLSEIMESLSKNKLRSVLTGFSIAWGIFMIVILLGAGNGLMNGLMSQMGNMMGNTVSIYSGYRQIPHKGYPKWQEINLDHEDIGEIGKIKGIEIIAPSAYVTTGGKIRYGESFQAENGVDAVEENNIILDNKSIVTGRYINRTDLLYHRKVVVIDDEYARTFITDREPVGQTLWIDEIPFKIIGTLKNEGSFSGRRTIQIPLSTYFSSMAKGQTKIKKVMIKCDDALNSEEMAGIENQISSYLKRKHSIAEEDRYAIYCWSNNSNKEFRMMKTGLNIFIWMIGIGTLLAGIVGVSNIMLVSVRERTSEIGIRKTFGARSGSIILMVLTEALVITMISGYLGMILGIGTMEGLSHYLETVPQETSANLGSFTFFKDPTLQLPVIISCTIALVIASLIAGYIPARKAAALKTIDALRYNK